MKKNQPSDNTAATPRPKRPVAQGSVGGVRGQLPTTVKKTSTVGKIVGGALLAVGVALVARRRKSVPATDQGATLDELLYFVNDRIEGYQRAVAESHDAELRGYYKQLASQSQQFATDLNTYLTREGGKRETSTTLKGKLYRAWMDAKAVVTARDEKSILSSNIYGEEWALKAYQEALAERTLTGLLRQAVERQYALSQHTYDRLKKLKAKQE
ncbi:ferritin-like domain-containing protein [Hymenobacter sp. BRD67]|uniref:ferritin-like domain-containing protein n=1 Tax=Hymenobacter sp. BRD67 TaxID=2675877 RepID=UPI001567AAEB|nr:PA2169 family four-helix-bundle protein [Hymenobacter sp. BRD67]QKG52445.1 PA2169 family four-helix-bundle protein [Hymenobacter sp. BRD67]